MTPLDDGFFHALQQGPDDDILRLVYADFLEDRGDDASSARAELIRVQVELAALAPASRWAMERATVLAARQEELLARWEREWLGPWADLLDGWAFRRGLVEAIRADASVFLAAAPEWFAEWPTLAVAKLTRASGHLPELAASPWLAHLRGLDLSDNDLAPEALAHLTSSRFICLLTALDLSGNPIGERGGALLASARSAGALTELHLARCDLGGCGLANLLSGCLRQLRQLDLSGNRLGRRDLLLLAGSPGTSGLVSLDLASNPLGDHGPAILVESPSAAGLVDLGLCDTGTGDAGVTALASSSHLAALRSLDLRGHQCRAQLDRDGEDWGGIGELSRSPLLCQLRRLLLTTSGGSNGWVAGMLNIVRPRRRRDVTPDWSVAHLLRKSRYLMPSQLVECDVEEIWWLGDTGNRQRLPSWWADE